VSLSPNIPRSDIERRSGLDRRMLSQDEREALRSCQLAAHKLSTTIRFQGIQEGCPSANLVPLVLFSVGASHSTLCVPWPCTAESIVARIERRKPVPASPKPPQFAGLWHRLGNRNAASNRAEKSA
jgi:hypothetical protein